MAVPRARAGQRGGDAAITVRRDVVVDEGTGLAAERRTVVAGSPEADGAALERGVTTEEQLRPIRPVSFQEINCGSGLPWLPLLAAS